MTAPQASSSLAVVKVTKEFPTPAGALAVLRGIDLALAAGSQLCILGASGSGKSTLLNILGTLEKPTAGTVRLGELDPFSLKPDALARFRAQTIGFVFQDHHLLPQCTAIENVLLPRLALGKVTADDCTRAESLLQQVGLEGRSTHLPAELSGGERQRVAVARALMNHPTLLLCDEPTGNLDAKTGLAIGELLLRVAGESSAMLVVVTHSQSLADMLPRRVRMEDGRIVE